MNMYDVAPSANKIMDTYSTSHLMNGYLFEFPDYDSYNVSGPGIGGQMMPHLLQEGRLPHKNNTQIIDITVNGNKDNNQVTNSAQFIFTNDASAYLTHTKQINSAVREQLSPLIQSYPISTASSYNSTSKKVRTRNYVEYFTNAQITAFTTSSHPDNFLDFKANNLSRNATDFPGDGIGAFQVTDTKGFTYHYSLPVYSQNSVTTSFDLNDTSFTPKSAGIDGNDYDPDTGDSLVKILKAYRVAKSWKLTAITGPDYIDGNGDLVADEGDIGYWVAYDYGLWAELLNGSLRFTAFNLINSILLQQITREPLPNILLSNTVKQGHTLKVKCSCII